MPRWPFRSSFEEECNEVFDMREKLAENNGVPNTRYWDRRLLVLSRYGGKCVCCGESHPKFLSIDHVGQTGAAHRASDPSAKNITEWLIKNNFPKGDFQILCHNCNMATRDGEPCPHNPLGAKTQPRKKPRRRRPVVEKEPEPGENRPFEYVPPELRQPVETQEERARFMDMLLAKRSAGLGLNGAEIVRERQDELRKVLAKAKQLEEEQHG